MLGIIVNVAANHGDVRFGLIVGRKGNRLLSPGRNNRKPQTAAATAGAEGQPFDAGRQWSWDSPRLCSGPFRNK